MEKIAEAIWIARGEIKRLDIKGTNNLRLLINRETFYELKRERSFAEENLRNPTRLTIFGIPIAETKDITGWELVIVQGSGE